MAGAYDARSGTGSGARDCEPRIGKDMKKLGILALAVLCAAAAFVMYRYHDVGTDHIVVKLAPGPPQPRVPPGEAGIDPAAINLAVEYADKRHTSALVI